MVIQPFGEYYSKIFAAIESGNARLQFSQIGEDALVWNRFREIKGGFYVDIGCHHPFRYSNTALLHLFNGWTGLNVDADRRAIELFVKHRPQDINIRCAVGNRTGQVELFLFKEGAVNTVDPGWAERQQQDYGAAEVATVDILPMRDLLDRYMPNGRTIDFLNIDIEGLDLEAAQSNDWQKYRPQLVCIETHGFNVNTPAENPTFQFMQSVGYHMIAHYYATSFYAPVS